MNEEFSVELTTEEREDSYGAVAIIFSRTENYFCVREEWVDMDVCYSDGYTISIPKRIWDLGLAWLASK